MPHNGVTLYGRRAIAARAGTKLAHPGYRLCVALLTALLGVLGTLPLSGAAAALEILPGEQQAVVRAGGGLAVLGPWAGPLDTQYSSNLIREPSSRRSMPRTRRVN